MSRPPVPLDEQAPLDLAIGGHVLRHVYEHETSAELTITVRNRQVGYTLISNAQPINLPDDELVQAICDLFDLHEQYASGLTQAIYQYRKDPAGSWTMHSRYHYT
ncbi:hypothetical protein [Nocardia sp. NPDC004415]